MPIETAYKITKINKKTSKIMPSHNSGSSSRKGVGVQVPSAA